MTDAAALHGEGTDERREATGFRLYLLLFFVVLSATLYATTLLVASVLLPQMQGTMSATQDEISWAMTFNILATAVATPTTGWLAGNFGNRRVMAFSVAGFTAATLMCGLADSLEALIFWRVVQGAVGAPVIPLSQTVLLGTFPKRLHGTVTSIFGMGVVIGPVIGPALGGYLSEVYSWRAAFFMIVPVGVIALVGLVAILPRDHPSGRARLDWTGFLTLSAAITCLQLMMSRGQRLDWFESPEIWLEACGAVLAFYLFLAHSLTADKPFLNLKLLLDRNYAIGLGLVTLYGMLNFTPVVLLPPLLQTHAGYPDSIIGEILAARGTGAVAGFFLAMFIGRFDPRFGLIVGFAIQTYAGYLLTVVDLNMTMGELALSNALQGLATGLIWVPLTILAFSTLDPRHLAETSAVFHLLRNLGSSVFISICVAEIVRATGANYARLIELINPYNPALSLPWVVGAWDVETTTGLAKLSKEINRQAAMIGYLNAFGMITAASALAIPLILLARTKRRMPA
ncbi:DHA2 family efflux MFS transporter permease subunit [Desertibaculum subflavum]|uniref:DHA2 family efflux MFS transporter permease subunit n=1 Tax=Desertibaculum subflavum TaxID=2268458 RepID=UPI000E665193